MLTAVCVFFVVLHTTLTAFFAIQLERERVRHRSREAALTDRVIEVASTKRWEDLLQLRKEMLLSQQALEVRTPEGDPARVAEDPAMRAY